MIQAIQVLRFHLLELEKVGIYLYLFNIAIYTMKCILIIFI